ncbi:pyridoxal-dependent decarboxylase [Streptomyces griseoloalbus]|uniref:pyridoxal phosphate-dependent decarboxylase family protein n=1 Tax=Streptomyces griseoloalbus TaxID=67303 RepID=UPI0018752A09|nr:pyridoxal-dependent decarboxylase [Streptomyces griseoloalbus]
MRSRSHLLNGATAERYHQDVSLAAARIARKLATTDRPFSGANPQELAQVVDSVDLDTPLGDTAAALDELERVYLRDAVYFHHPRYLAHLNCPLVLPAVVGEAVIAAVNSSMDTWDQSGGATLMERRLVDWTAARIGLGTAADGVFTSGGTQSNMHAMLLAREETLRLAAKKARIPGDAPDSAAGRAELLPTLRVLTSEISHFSIEKSARVLGLAPDAVIPVPVDAATRRMRPDALAHELERCTRAGKTVMAVVATAGTTDFGSIDPLPRIADLCEQYDTWLHVDAAYGCGLLVSPTRRHLLAGIERADSVTVDYHKSFFQPVSASAIVVRDRTVLGHATHHADYLNPEWMAEKAIPNQVNKSLQTTRRFDALKLWMTLRIMGPDAVGELFDEVVDRAAQAWQLLQDDPRFDVAVRPELSTLVFRYRPAPGTAADLADSANLHAREALAATGEAVIASTVVDGRHWLKFTLLNPLTSLEDISTTLDLVAQHAERHLAVPGSTVVAT